MKDRANPTSVEMLAEDFLQRQQSGERPSISEYVEKYPDLADEIRELFPAISVMEEFKRKSDRVHESLVSLGPSELKRIGKFRILHELGRGGMGIVYEAEEEGLGRRVALKILPRSQLLTNKGLKRFQKEASIAARLEHPHIVPIFSASEAEGFHYIAMKLVRGVGWDRLIETLASTESIDGLTIKGRPSDLKKSLTILASFLFQRSQDFSRKRETGPPPLFPMKALKGKVDWHSSGGKAVIPFSKKVTLAPGYYREAARMTLQAAEALHHAHMNGTLHRDIKPGNLLLDTEGHVWITDFGLAKAMESAGDSTTGGILGTIRFMAPEEFEGKTDARGDIYSLGLSLYELIVLKPAFQGKSHSELIRKILYERLKPPRRINPLVPEDLEFIVLKATARKADQRYQTARAMTEDLRRFLKGQRLRAVAEIPEEVPRWFGFQSRRSAMAYIGSFSLAVAISALIGAWNPFASSTDQPPPESRSGKLVSDQGRSDSEPMADENEVQADEESTAEVFEDETTASVRETVAEVEERESEKAEEDKRQRPPHPPGSKPPAGGLPPPLLHDPDRPPPRREPLPPHERRTSPHNRRPPPHNRPR